MTFHDLIADARKAVFDARSDLERAVAWYVLAEIFRDHDHPHQCEAAKARGDQCEARHLAAEAAKAATAEPRAPDLTPEAPPPPTAKEENADWNRFVASCDVAENPQREELEWDCSHEKAPWSYKVDASTPSAIGSGYASTSLETSPLDTA